MAQSIACHGQPNIAGRALGADDRAAIAELPHSVLTPALHIARGRHHARVLLAGREVARRNPRDLSLGVEEYGSPAMPSWPTSLFPQHQTDLSKSSTHVCFSPAATAVGVAGNVTGRACVVR